MSSKRPVISYAPVSSASGNYPGRTAKGDFHEDSSNTGKTIIESWEGICYVSCSATDPQLSFHINIHENLGPDGNVVTTKFFTPELMYPIIALNPNGTYTRVYPVEQVDIYISDLLLPYQTLNFISNKRLLCNTSLLADSITFYYGPLGRDAIYKVRLEHVGYTSMYYPSYIGGLELKNNNTYSGILKWIIETNVFVGGPTPPPAPNSGEFKQNAMWEWRQGLLPDTEPTIVKEAGVGSSFKQDPKDLQAENGILTEEEIDELNDKSKVSTAAIVYPPGVPLPTPQVLYVRLRKRNASTEGRWVDIDSPDVEGSVRGLIRAPFNPPPVNGIYTLYINSLEPNTEYSYYVCPVTVGGEFEEYIKAGEPIGTDLYEHWRTRLNQPQNMSRFKTPRLPSDPRSRMDVINFGFGSCFDSIMNSLEGVSDVLLSFFFMDGDTYYMDNAKGGSDFIRRYLSLFRNPYIREMVQSTALICSMDDHEVEDNWDGRLDYITPVSNKFLLASNQIAAYNALFAITSKRWSIPFRMSGAGGIQPITSFPTSFPVRINECYNAFYQALPAVPRTADPNGPNFYFDEGPCRFIYIHSKPYVTRDNSGNLVSVQFWKTQAKLFADGTYGPLEAPNGSFIPPPGEAFLKQALTSGRQLVNFVLFSATIQPTYKTASLAAMRNTFVTQMRLVTPSISVSDAEDAFNKLHYQSLSYYADGYQAKLNALHDWMRQMRIKNVFWLNGDPHTSNQCVIDPINNYNVLTSSTVGNYRSNGSTSQDFGKPGKNPGGIDNVSPNSWMRIEVHPYERRNLANEAGVTVWVKYGRQVLREITYPVVMSGNSINGNMVQLSLGENNVVQGFSNN